MSSSGRADRGLSRCLGGGDRRCGADLERGGAAAGTPAPTSPNSARPTRRCSPSPSPPSDGAVYAAGDAATRFTIQSVSKPFTYAAALDRLGREAVLPAGRRGADRQRLRSTSRSTRSHNRPMNPMVNAGAIAMADLIHGATGHAREQALRALMARFAGRELELDRAVYASEKETGHRNRAIAWMMTSTGHAQARPRRCSTSISGNARCWSTCAISR